MSAELSKAQTATLRTLVRNGGEMNGFGGQPGFWGNSVPVLIRLGLVEDLGTCTCYGNEDGPCDREHATVSGRSGHKSYNRVRITDAGRAAIAE